jgi:hypothetical protein
MDYFRRDNTEGYDAADLAILNAAWNSLPISVADRGLRGGALVAAYYAVEC